MTEPTIPFWKKGIGKSVTVGDGQAIFSESYIDKTIYERFEQPFKCSPDNVCNIDSLTSSEKRES